RPTVPVLQLLTDRRFLRLLNAYLTVSGPDRKAYAYAVATWKAGVTLPMPEPYAELPPQERELLTARMAYWRREMADVLHILRQITGRDPRCAPAWALMGEFYLTVGRLEEGIQALEHAVAAAPAHEHAAARLAQARAALAGEVELQIEPSPEEEMLREERATRWRLTLPLLIAGGLVLVGPLLVRPAESELGLLALPWLRVFLTAAGILLAFFALGYGRIIQPFERVMIWSSVSASDRGSPRSYPYALIILVTAVASMWLTVIALGIIAALDEEWPGAPSLLIGACIGATVALAGLLAAFHLPWENTVVFGGNLPVIAGMLGWWFGSLGTPTYD
ncbi:MAG TPA: hypothetical protein PLZ36_10175, partial [Armatimonadota bacterium]|nr:hypothetical protein [Armatimonadota bacterium]